MAKRLRNYAATEGTLINIRALKKRVDALEKQVKGIYVRLNKPQGFPAYQGRERRQARF